MAYELGNKLLRATLFWSSDGLVRYLRFEKGKPVEIKTALLALLASLALLTQAWADCKCECKNGMMQPVCTRQMDARPICPILCPTPVDQDLPKVPCRQLRKCDEFGRCQWEWEGDCL